MREGGIVCYVVYKTSNGFYRGRCSNTPCKNGGNCFDLTAGFVLCECPDTHGGHFCESRCTLTANSVVLVLYFVFVCLFVCVYVSVYIFLTL